MEDVIIHRPPTLREMETELTFLVIAKKKIPTEQKTYEDLNIINDHHHHVAVMQALTILREVNKIPACMGPQNVVRTHCIKLISEVEKARTQRRYTALHEAGVLRPALHSYEDDGPPEEEADLFAGGMSTQELRDAVRILLAWEEQEREPAIKEEPHSSQAADPTTD